MADPGAPEEPASDSDPADPLASDLSADPAGPDARPVRPEPLIQRLHRALGPLAGGLILDFVDLAMFGPLGLALGPAVGALVGWWVSSLYGFARAGRATVALLSAVYVSVPFTEVLPLATLVSAIARFRSEDRGGTAPDVSPREPE